MKKILQNLKNLWSISDFKDQQMLDFSHQQLQTETQQGLKVMSTLLILLILIAMLLFKQLGQLGSNYNINYFWVMALAAHINLSARVIIDIKTLHTLGIALLVISATAYVFMAHQTGGFSPLLIANIVLLFMCIPLIPWGLREATAIVMAIYFLLTLSTLSVTNRFDSETFRVLQFFLLAAGTTSLILVLRATRIRKNELVSHFNLQKAHAELYTLSNTDPLTGAWNRRYTEIAIDNLIRDFNNVYSNFHFIIFDLNNFKSLNDLFGHDLGDRVLVVCSQTIIKRLEQSGYLIRIGGDEFIILLVGQRPEQLMHDIELQINSQVQQINNQAQFGFSWGSVTLPLKVVHDLESVYQKADQGLYKQKQGLRRCDSRYSQG